MTRPDEGDRCKAPECYGVLEVKAGRDCSCHLSAPCGSCVDTGLRCSICDATPDEAAQLAQGEAESRLRAAARASFEEPQRDPISRGSGRTSIHRSYRGEGGPNFVD